MELSDLHAAYEEWLGAPDQVIQIRSTAADEPVGALDLLYYGPIEEDEIEHSTLATAGLGLRRLPDPCPHAELSLDVRGALDADQLREFGAALAALIEDRLRAGAGFAPNLVLDDLRLPLFRRMSSLLLTDWAKDSPQWLTTDEPSIRMLRAIPLYAEEAAWVRQIGDSAAISAFRRGGVKWSDPERPPLMPDEGASPGASTPDPAEIERLWQEIAAWYRANGANAADELNPGASEEQVAALESQLGLTLPADFRASLLTHNGAPGFHSYRALTVAGIARIWSGMQQLSAAGSLTRHPEGEGNVEVIQDTPWNPAWVPFAEDSGGNLICLDLAPGPRGRVGQVIYLEQVEGPLASPYGSFDEWLRAYRDGLQRGGYMVNAEGFIVERM